MSDLLQNPTLTLPEALRQADAHWQAGQAAQAEHLCRNILAALPGQPDALHLLGLMAHAYGRLDDAIDFLRQACAAPQVAPVYWSNLAEMYRQKGRLQDGEAAARQAVALNPTLSGAWNNLGILLQEMGQYAESRLCLEKVAQWEPENPQVLNNLGNTCMRQGDTAAAERYWREAMARHPRYAQPHSNLAKLLADRGALDDAIREGRLAITLDPHLADAYVNLAGAELERKRTADALRWIDALLTFQPRHPQGLAARARILKEAERLPEALAAAEAAVEAAPEYADAHYALGSVLREMGRPEAALAAYAKAAQLPGTKVEDALIGQATLYMEQGDKAHSEAFFQRTVERFPQSVSAWYNWADLHRFTPDDPLIPQLTALLEAEAELLPKDRTLLHFALGKAYLDAGDPERAFAHLHQGNTLKRQTFTYDPASATALVEAIIAAFPAEEARDPASSANRRAVAPEDRPGPVPVFVVGMPRSGTTLLEQILASHPAVHGAGELLALRQVVESVGPYPESLQSLVPEQYRALGRQYLEQVAPQAPEARYLVDKMPSNGFYASLILRMLPQAKIIHSRRDAVDTCLSCYSKHFSGEQLFSYDLEELGQFYRDYDRLMAHWRNLLPAESFLEVDYEAVVQDQEGQTRRLLDFLGLDWDPACLEFHRTARPVRTASVNQVRQPLYSSAVGRGRRYEAHLQPLLAVLNGPADSISSADSVSPANG